MKTGIELIAQERQEQIEKHGFTVEDDVICSSNGELINAAVCLCREQIQWRMAALNHQETWNLKHWLHACEKPYIERLAIAGALIAAEIDRLQATTNQ